MINNRNKAHLRIYTDGSKVDESTTSAIWTTSLGVEESWKLNHDQRRSILGAELNTIS